MTYKIIVNQIIIHFNNLLYFRVKLFLKQFNNLDYIIFIKQINVIKNSSSLIKII